jgi:hypothetical protein
MLHCTEIGENWPLPCRAPARNCDGLAALSEGKGKGEGGGGSGPFIGAARAGNGQGVMRD